MRKGYKLKITWIKKDKQVELRSDKTNLRETKSDRREGIWQQRSQEWVTGVSFDNPVHEWPSCSLLTFVKNDYSEEEE